MVIETPRGSRHKYAFSPGQLSAADIRIRCLLNIASKGVRRALNEASRPSANRVTILITDSVPAGATDQR